MSTVSSSKHYRLMVLAYSKLDRCAQRRCCGRLGRGAGSERAAVGFGPGLDSHIFAGCAQSCRLRSSDVLVAACWQSRGPSVGGRQWSEKRGWGRFDRPRDAACLPSPSSLAKPSCWWVGVGANCPYTDASCWLWATGGVKRRTRKLATGAKLNTGTESGMRRRGKAHVRLRRARTQHSQSRWSKAKGR